MIHRKPFSHALLRYFCRGLAVALFLVSGLSALQAQAPVTETDSALKAATNFDQLSSATKVLAVKELAQRKADFIEHQAVMQQSKHFVLIKKELEKARSFLRQGYDSDDIYREINELMGWQKLAGEGVITNRDEFQTVRNLTTTSILLKELLNRTNNRLKQILVYHKTLGQLQYRIDSLLMDSLLYHVPNDSIALARYFQRLVLLNQDLKPVGKPLKDALDSVQRIEIKVNMIKFGLESDIAEAESQRKMLFEKVGLIEKGTFGLGVAKDQSVGKVIRFSLLKAWMVLVFYIFNHYSLLLLMVLTVIGVTVYMNMLRRRSAETRFRMQNIDDLHFLNHPVASSIVLVVTTFQFFLPLPPFIFSGSLWMVCGFALSMVMRKPLPSLWYKAWLFFFGLFLIGFAGNLLLRQSAFERWTMPFFIILGLAAGIFFLLRIRRREISEKLLLLFIGIMVMLELMALANYISGGYNQAKTFLISGVFTVIVAYFIYWAARIGKRTLQLSYHFHKGHEDDHVQAVPDETNRKSSVLPYFLFFIGWFILIGRSFYFYQNLVEPIAEALVATRTIGEFTFTYASIFIFFLVLFIAGIVSQVVSFVAAETPQARENSKSGGLGSWMLLIRIAIITAGVLLAFVSAGIPMDRFAIILGALSVGIGFGLQTLVNNLVSGLIIAFEKPVNVGDIVDIAGQTGKMKSIGIRSSMITTWDGSDVIIPNGDLLNQHLVNWTLGSTKRRFNLPVGVEYGTNLEEAKGLLLELMQKDPRILANPQPFVQATTFNNSSIDLILKFWVAHFDLGLDVKSDLIVAIDALFREHNIVIPFPQQDVHIRSAEGLREQEPE